MCLASRQTIIKVWEELVLAMLCQSQDAAAARLRDAQQALEAVQALVAAGAAAAAAAQEACEARLTCIDVESVLVSSHGHTTRRISYVIFTMP